MKYYYPIIKKVPESEQSVTDKLLQSVSHIRAYNIDGGEVDLKSFDSKLEKLIKSQCH